MLDFTDDTAPHQASFESYGISLRVCANSEEILRRAESFLPPGWRPAATKQTQHRIGILMEGDGTYSIYNGGTRVSQGQGLELSLIVLEGQVRGYVALHSPEMIFIHAGVVARDGRAIMFPGHSFSGKTSVVAALVRTGATYYSDEYAVLDADGLVHPYAKPLSLRPDPADAQIDTPVEQLGGVAGETPVPLGLTVVTYYRPSAEWKPERITSGEAALALLAHSVQVRVRPTQAMHAIRRAVEKATALEGERGEADALAEQLLEGAHV